METILYIWRRSKRLKKNSVTHKNTNESLDFVLNSSIHLRVYASLSLRWRCTPTEQMLALRFCLANHLRIVRIAFNIKDKTVKMAWNIMHHVHLAQKWVRQNVHCLRDQTPQATQAGRAPAPPKSLRLKKMMHAWVEFKAITLRLSLSNLE